MAFCLAILLDDNHMDRNLKEMLVTTTMVVVLFTVFVQVIFKKLDDFNRSVELILKALRLGQRDTVYLGVKQGKTRAF